MRTLKNFSFCLLLFLVTGTALAQEVTLTFVNKSDENVFVRRWLASLEHDDEWIKTNMPEKQFLAPKQSVSYTFDKGTKYFSTKISIYPAKSAETGDSSVCYIGLVPDLTGLTVDNGSYKKLHCWNRRNTITIGK